MSSAHTGRIRRTLEDMISVDHTMAVEATHVRALLQEYGFRSYAKLEEHMSAAVLSHHGTLDDVLRYARRKQDLPPLLVLQEMAEAMGVRLGLVMRAALRDAGTSTSEDAEAQLVIDLMATVPPESRERVYRVMVEVVGLVPRGD